MEIVVPSLKVESKNLVYYVSSVKLNIACKIFMGNFNNLESLNLEKVSKIEKLILSNMNKLILDSFTVFFENEYKFSEILENNNFGNLILSLIDNNFYMFEDENLKVALNKVFLEEKSLKDESIIIVFLPVENIKNAKDLVLKISSIDNLHQEDIEPVFDIESTYKNNPFYESISYLLENLPTLKNKIDFESTSLALRSKKLFTINNVLDVSTTLLDSFLALSTEEKSKLLLDFWLFLFEIFIEWEDQKPSEIREKYIHSSSIVLSSIADISRKVITKYKNDWKKYLFNISKINWEKSNIDWSEEGIKILEDKSVISSIDSKNKLISYLVKKLGFIDVNLSPKDLFTLFIEKYQNYNTFITYNQRGDGNISLNGGKKIFCYLDFVDNGRFLVARLKIDPENTLLNNFDGLWRKTTVKHAIGSWGKNVVDVPIISAEKINDYIELMEITRKAN